MMAGKNLVSPPMSFQNWSAKEWFKGNWKTIKEILKVGIPFVATTFFTDGATQAFVGTVVGKFILDAGEFYFKKVSLK